MTRPQAVQATIDILLTIRDKITDDTDVIWTYFETPAECRAVIEQCLTDLVEGDNKAINELDILFMPTGTVQEHSMANGWRKEYLKLANQFDRLQPFILSV